VNDCNGPSKARHPERTSLRTFHILADSDNALIGLLLIRRSETAFRYLNGTEGNLAVRQSEKRAGMNKHVQAYFLKDLVPGWRQSETVPPSLRAAVQLTGSQRDTLSEDYRSFNDGSGVHSAVRARIYHLFGVTF
jgi:hypothetical protein